MKTRHVDSPRSAIIVFRFFVVTLAKFQTKRHTLISRTLCGLACAPRTSLTPGFPVESQPPFLHDRSKSFVLFVPLPAADPFRGYNSPKEIFLYYSIFALKLIVGNVTNFRTTTRSPNVYRGASDYAQQFSLERSGHGCRPLDQFKWRSPYIAALMLNVNARETRP